MKFSLPSLTIAAALVLAASTAVDAACSRIATRREIRELSSDEREAFFGAMSKLQKQPQPNGLDKLINDHMKYAANAHGVAAFFPWHREYLRRFQELLTNIDSSVTIAYWDSAMDSQAPEKSPIFGPNWLGGNGRGANSCVQDGKLKDYRPYYPTPGACYTRKFDGVDGAVGALFSTDMVANLLAEAKDYNKFRVDYEGSVHARVHNAIGGTFSSMSSPSDLIFWMHHTLVDKHWAEWQAPGHGNDYGPTAPSENLVPWDIPASSTFDTTAEPFCYTYSNMNKASAEIKNAPMPDAAGMSDKMGDMGGSLLRRSIDTILARRGYQASPSPAPVNGQKPAPRRKCVKKPDPLAHLLVGESDRKNLLNIRVPPPTPEAWCKMNNVSVAEVRAVESRNVELTKIVNSIPGYISQSALFNRPDLLVKIVESAKEFTGGYLNGKELKFSLDCNSNPLEAVEKLRKQVMDAVKTSPDASEVTKLLGADTAKLISGYNGGVTITDILNKAKSVVEQVVGPDGKVSLPTDSATLSKLVGKLTGNGTPAAQ
ncbi:hypothetical protein THASP1DRAFT_25056 [Thamnocephalis sphaerospora]|uniref:Tyrosinase copper-binding domain-containing protein n=1 Tax=Thamnocephalis sphaerospora TaxID=78915 RepID=A0A4P9XLI7_9FUNG|nr:hypothetical protein THASP1DRAFT_25056 [Thamnocephalis sphaerospora]|eukprot:RKP06672.1 hypothetical protein THASP1DRAFT_25056 [Thamnocephalis sphaerospora]